MKMFTWLSNLFRRRPQEPIQINLTVNLNANIRGLPDPAQHRPHHTVSASTDQIATPTTPASASLKEIVIKPPEIQPSFFSDQETPETEFGETQD